MKLIEFPHGPRLPELVPWGSETRIRSCGGAVILVDQPAEQIPSANIPLADLDRLPGLCER